MSGRNEKSSPRFGATAGREGQERGRAMTTEERLAKVEREVGELRMTLLRVAELLASQHKLSKPKRPPTRPQADGRVIGLMDNWTDEKPVAYFFLGQRYEVKTWKAVLLGVCGTLADVPGVDFARVLSLRGFSRNRTNMRDPREIAGSGIYVAANLSAHDLKDRCREVLGKFGHSASELKVELRDR